MPLRTVKVSLEMEPFFEEAEEVVSAYFARRKDEPERGSIDISDQRYLLVRGASLSVEFFSVVRDLLGSGRETEADLFSRNLLFDLAHAMGKADAASFHEAADSRWSTPECCHRVPDLRSERDYGEATLRSLFVN